MRLPQSTEMRVSIPGHTLTFRVEGNLSHRHRRALCLFLLRHLKPAIRQIRNVTIRHRDEHHLNWIHLFDRPVSLSQALHSHTDPEKLGFEIRMRRLNSRMTQRELATASGLSETQLSHIEHGKVTPRVTTLRRIEAALRG